MSEPKLRIKNIAGGCSPIRWRDPATQKTFEVSIEALDFTPHIPSLTTPKQCRKLATWLLDVADKWESER